MTVTARTFDAGALRRSAIVLALAGLFAVIVALRLPFCPMAGVLGLPCPGCGLTRATLALVRGDVRAALHLHPLVLVIAPLFTAAVANAAVAYVRGPRSDALANANANAKPWLSSPLATAIASSLLALTLGVWVARFYGYFGGPAPVQTIAAWAAQARPHPR